MALCTASTPLTRLDETIIGCASAPAAERSKRNFGSFDKRDDLGRFDVSATLESQIFTISSSDLQCPHEYEVGGVNPLSRDGYIEYAFEKYEDVPARFVFFGPYITLDPGIYFFSFLGSLEGALEINFCGFTTHRTLKDVTLSNFDTPICLTLLEAVNDFEIRGRKTDQLTALRLEGIEVERLAIAEIAAASD